MARKDKQQADIRFPDQKIVVTQLEEEMQKSVLSAVLQMMTLRYTRWDMMQTITLYRTSPQIGASLVELEMWFPAAGLHLQS